MLLLISALMTVCLALPKPEDVIVPKYIHRTKQHFSDAVIPPKPEGNFTLPGDRQNFKYKWVAYGGQCYDSKVMQDMVEIAGTQLLPESYHQTGCEIIGLMTRNMPVASFNEFARSGSVGLFTYTDKTTIFPEYEHLRDRPECAGTCSGSCSNTCTADGRKYDSLAGLGGVRGTCLDDNYMCTWDDPYGKVYSVLVHEVAHTIHQYALPDTTNLWQEIYNAWLNARQYSIWTLSSYAMSNHLEYFAEATGVYFDTNNHWSSSGGMNSCGHPSGFCQSEAEARRWLESQDPMLYDCLKLAWSNNDDSLPGGMSICP